LMKCRSRLHASCVGRPPCQPSWNSPPGVNITDNSGAVQQERDGREVTILGQPPALEKDLCRGGSQFHDYQCAHNAGTGGFELRSTSATASLAELFGLVTLLLATVGLCGVTAYTVAQRTSEIGGRMALGADRMSVVQLVLGGATVRGGRLGCGRAFPRRSCRPRGRHRFSRYKRCGLNDSLLEGFKAPTRMNCFPTPDRPI
jgi:hypothetical protein